MSTNLAHQEKMKALNEIIRLQKVNNVEIEKIRNLLEDMQRRLANLETSKNVM